VWPDLFRRQTLASFDFQWRALADGDAMLSDPWFRENVDRILAEELLAMDRGWFRRRRVLDAGCGGGRWTCGFLRLGARVTAVDASPHALEATLAQARQWAPEAVAEGRLETARADLLALPDDLAARRFDVVFCFGVLHHTGDTRRALGNVAALVADEGVLFLYLYGRRTVTWPRRLALSGFRYALAPLPFPAKTRILRRAFPGRDPHQAFDLLSPTVNDRLDHAEVEGWLRDLGLSEVVRTLDHTELFLRATRPGTARTPALPFRALPNPPYWFERYRRG
jgi:SAM-dependent methyltransferase